MNNKTNIEEDIEILENLKEKTEEAYNCSLASGNERKDWQREVQAIENILADRERLIKENEKLIYARKWYFEHTVGKIVTPEMLHKILSFEYISKEEIKEKIERLKKEYEEVIEKNGTKAFILKCQITILEELLDTEK